MADASAIPVGFVTPFAGDLTQPATLQAVMAAGWLPCDGRAYEQQSYPELFAVIGTLHGGGPGTFNVPNLSARFVRGTSGDSGRDPDATLRQRPPNSSAYINGVGSLQGAATAPPQTPASVSQSGAHHHQYQHLNTDMHEAWNGSSYTMARWSSTVAIGAAGGHTHAVSGGDAKTVPVSLALSWLIRAKSGAGAGHSPAGAIGAQAVDVMNHPPAAGWLYCNGASLPRSGPAAPLAAIIGANYGGAGANFSLPDVRGRFLRGADHGVGRDPDAAHRAPSAPGGASGDAVGSAQAPATGPSANPFVVAAVGDHTHPQTLVPENDHHAAWGASGPLAFNCMVWTDDFTQTSDDGVHTHTLAGGDHETRPDNIYLDWLIAEDALGDAPPVGSIMALGPTRPRRPRKRRCMPRAGTSASASRSPTTSR